MSPDNFRGEYNEPSLHQAHQQQAQAHHLHLGRVHLARCGRADCRDGGLSLITMILMVIMFFMKQYIRHCFQR